MRRHEVLVRKYRVMGRAAAASVATRKKVCRLYTVPCSSSRKGLYLLFRFNLIRRSRIRGTATHELPPSWNCFKYCPFSPWAEKASWRALALMLCDEWAACPALICGKRRAASEASQKWVGTMDLLLLLYPFSPSSSWGRQI